MKHTDIKKLFAEAEAFVGTSPVICGWVRTARDSKNVSFLEVNDGTCFRSLQLVIDKEKMDESNAQMSDEEFANMLEDRLGNIDFE